MTAIEVHDLGKNYRRYDSRRPSTLQEAVLSAFKHFQPAESRWSLRHVSFELLQGRVLGVIGRNGAGKSTLLRLIGGVALPDEGSVKVHGKLGALLELTAGFHPDLTGRENTEIGGVLRGLTRAEVRRRFDSIVDFAELESAIDAPLRTYSSGMQMRLAFAVAIHCEPDILLVDEVLAVGDAGFQSKCLDRIKRLRARGCSILLVSHDTALVQQMCDDALWLKEGAVAAFGTVREVTNEYGASLQHETLARTPLAAEPSITSQGMVLRMGTHRFGALEIEITDVRLRTGSDASGLELSDGDWLSVDIDYRVNQAVDVPILNVTLIHDDGRVCISASTQETQLQLPADAGSAHISVRWPHVAVEPGIYFVEVGVYPKDWAFAYDYHCRSYPLVVRHRGSRSGGPARIAGARSRAEWAFDQERQVS